MKDEFFSRLLPAPRRGGFAMEGYWVWCGSVIRGEDGRYHMFASRWPKFEGVDMPTPYTSYSEVVRAESATPIGPFEFKEVVLPARGACFWDGRMTHNPTIHKVGGKYLLYYIGSTYEGEPPTAEEMRHPDFIASKRNERWRSIRIGLAVSESVRGPWQRFDRPVLEPRPNHWDHTIVTNPAPCVLPDGRIFMLYRSIASPKTSARIGLAVADNYLAEFTRPVDEPVLRFDGADKIEDPYLWWNGEGFEAIVKDISGTVTGESGSGFHVSSVDGVAWKLSDPIKAYSRRIRWDYGIETMQGSFERPQLLFENGVPTHLYAATGDGPGSFENATQTWNMVIPLKRSESIPVPPRTVDFRKGDKNMETRNNKNIEMEDRRSNDPSLNIKPLSVTDSSSQLKLLFSGPQDLADTWGKLHFAVTPVRLIREVEEPPFNLVGCFPLADGSWEVFGQQFEKLTPGEPWYNDTTKWKLIRSITTDGVTFTNIETVIEDTTGTWTSHLAMAYNPDAGEYLLLKLSNTSYGFAYHAFFSSNGRQWREHSDNPLFYDGDAISVFWSPVLKQYVLVSKCLQPWKKHFMDHGGTTKSLNDESYRDRRVLMMRFSSDGRNWNPSEDLPDIYDLHDKKAIHPVEWLTVPDENDPPDIEFYSGNGFWYHDRAYMMVLNYAPSPLFPNKHAPQMDNEWWTSVDGHNWERPARGINVMEVKSPPEAKSDVGRFDMPPMVIDGNLIWRAGKKLVGLPEDRISGVSARANGEFSTKPFKMPEADLFLNAAVPAQERAFAQKQAYVMVAVLDGQGRVIPGFEAEKCVIQKEDRSDILLTWGEATARHLAGNTIRLRFFFRSANIYAVTAKSQGSISTGS